MKKYLIGAIPLIISNEIVSWATLCILAVMLIVDMAWATEGKL